MIVVLIIANLFGASSYCFGNEQWYYYLDENNDYIRMDKKNLKAEDILLKNVYYVHNLDKSIIKIMK